MHRVSNHEIILRDASLRSAPQDEDCNYRAVSCSGGVGICAVGNFA